HEDRPQPCGENRHDQVEPVGRLVRLPLIHNHSRHRRRLRHPLLRPLVAIPPPQHPRRRHVVIPTRGRLHHVRHANSVGPTPCPSHPSHASNQHAGSTPPTWAGAKTTNATA